MFKRTAAEVLKTEVGNLTLYSGLRYALSALILLGCTNYLLFAGVLPSISAFTIADIAIYLAAVLPVLLSRDLFNNFRGVKHQFVVGKNSTGEVKYGTSDFAERHPNLIKDVTNLWNATGQSEENLYIDITDANLHHVSIVDIFDDRRSHIIIPKKVLDTLDRDELRALMATKVLSLKYDYDKITGSLFNQTTLVLTNVLMATTFIAMIGSYLDPISALVGVINNSLAVPALFIEAEGYAAALMRFGFFYFTFSGWNAGGFRAIDRQEALVSDARAIEFGVHPNVLLNAYKKLEQARTGSDPDKANVRKPQTRGNILPFSISDYLNLIFRIRSAEPTYSQRKDFLQNRIIAPSLG